MRLRPIRIEDRPYLRELLQSTDEFTSSEVACAVELIEDAALRPSDSGYWGVVAADDADLPLAFPDGWEVTTCPPTDAPDMTAAEVAAAIASPIGTVLIAAVELHQRLEASFVAGSTLVIAGVLLTQLSGRLGRRRI